MSQVWLVRVSDFNDHEGSPDVAGVSATQEGARKRAEEWAAERNLTVKWFPTGSGLLKTKPETIDGKKPRPERMVADVEIERWEVIE